MSVEIKVPSVGESITEGVLARWMKKDGDAVRSGEPLFELETDKATTEVPAPTDGFLSISVREGTTVAIGSIVGKLSPSPAGAVPAKKETAPALPASAPKPPAEARKVEEKSLLLPPREGPAPAEVRPAPPEGRTSPPPEPRKDAGQRETRVRMSAIRQRIAARLVEAQHNAAILTTFNEIDMSAVMSLRAKFKEAFQKKHGVSLGLLSFFVKACVDALKAYPAVNARIDGADIVYHNFYDIGIAVSTDKGLMVPVLRDCDGKSFAGIEKAVAEVAQKARDGKITVNDLQGGTFTITNGGVFGSLLSTPILNPPQSGILGMHTIQKRPVAVDDQVVIRPMMYVALSYDHRLIDGREAVGFLVRVKECVEQPERMLLSM